MIDKKLNVYYEALKRIDEGNPLRVGTSEKISLRSVAIEAGRSAGAIKKSRPLYAQLIDDIKLVAENNTKKKNHIELALDKAKQNAETYRKLYEETLAREVVLLSRALKK